MGAARGSAFLMIIQLSMIVSVVGLSAITIARIEHRGARADGDLTSARLHARAAIDMGLRMIEQDPGGWRTTFQTKSVITNQSIGTGTFSLDADDPNDGVIDDDPTEPVELVGTGVQGSARYLLRVTLEPRSGSMVMVRGTWRRDVLP